VTAQKLKEEEIGTNLKSDQGNYSQELAESWIRGKESDDDGGWVALLGFREGLRSNKGCSFVPSLWLHEETFFGNAIAVHHYVYISHKYVVCRKRQQKPGIFGTVILVRLFLPTIIVMDNCHG